MANNVNVPTSQIVAWRDMGMSPQDIQIAIQNYSNTPTSSFAAPDNTSLPLQGVTGGDGLGSYGTLTDAYGQTTGVSQDAFNSMTSAGGPGEGYTLKANTQPDTGITGYQGAQVGLGIAGLAMANQAGKAQRDYMGNLVRQGDEKIAVSKDTLALAQDKVQTKKDSAAAFGSAFA